MGCSGPRSTKTPLSDDERAVEAKRSVQSSADLPRRQFASGVDTRRRTLRRTSRGKIVGRSLVLARVVELIDRAAKSDCTVLVTGETGTGKEAVVAALHDASLRRAGPLVTVNCGAMPESLMESELFGHERGAFTGATAAARGRVAEAEGGTLFLDEVSELPLSLQVKILRLLQQREYRPVGGQRALQCDVRFAAATNRDLAQCVAQGTFREDLYYRLHVVPIHLPPLRERAEDIDVLAEHFYAQALSLSGRTDLLGFAPDALEAMHRHDWPGNIRELENVVHRLVLLCAGPRIGVQDVAAHVSSVGPPRGFVSLLPESGMDLRAEVRRYEASLVLQALERTHWNKKRAAVLLGLQRTTLLDMIKRMALAR